MKKVINLVFAAAMMFSVVFIGDAISSNAPFSVNAQQVTVKKRRKGVIRKTYAGGKWVVRKTWNGTKYVSRKVWVGTKWTAKKTWKGGRKVVSRTKKIVY
ncbi:MAG TPA: hypothetical protein VNB22_13770 [Pyrinomonadaceae bacterium]|nr:hypothetical protein [Pyrinomonadaceae bacterium]